MNTMVCGGLLSLMLVAGFTAYGYQVSSMSSMASALAIDVLKSPVAALPPNVFSIWMNFSGSILANYWNKRPCKG